MQRRDFKGGFFFGFGSTSIRSTVITGQTEGLKVGCGGMGGRRDGWMGGLVDRWMGGFAKVDNRFGYEIWTKTKGFIKTKSLKGGV